MIDATILIPLLIIAVTQMVKMALPQVTGFITILIALVIGVLVAVLDVPMGIADITIAQGLYYGLGAVGITALASKAGGGAKGDDTVAPR